MPGWTGARVVYGHPYETLNAEQKQKQVLDWYTAPDGTDCSALLNQYDVRYILYGPEEQKLGQTSCLADLQMVAQFGDVAVYAP